MALWHTAGGIAAADDGVSAYRSPGAPTGQMLISVASFDHLMPSMASYVPSMPSTTITDSAESADPGPARRVEDQYEYLTRPDASIQSVQDNKDQPWLFPPSDLVVPDGVLRIRKAVAAIHAVPVGTTEVTLNTRRLFDALIIVAQMDIRGRHGLMDRIKQERVSPFFEVRITELARLAGIKGKNYKRIYADLDEIFRMTLEWNIIGEDSTVEWQMRAHFLSTYGRGVGGNAGLIRFSMDPSILAIVLDPANWATLSLQVLRGMPTLASYQLYQNVWRYINTAQKVTATLPVETWIELLLGPSRFVKVDAKTKKKVAVEYGDFKRRYLVDAIERVNATSALDHVIELKEIRSGNRVAKLQFKFRRKTQQRLDFDLPMAWDQTLIDRLRVMGFSTQEVSEISQLHSSDRVIDALLKLGAASERMSKNGSKLNSPRGYLLAILDSMLGAPAGLAAESADDVDRAALLDKERAEEERAFKLAEAFAVFNRECFREAMKRAEPDLVERCRSAFTSSAEYASHRFVVERAGWDTTAAVAVFNSWLRDHQPELYAQVLVRAEEREFDAWLPTAQ